MIGKELLRKPKLSLLSYRACGRIATAACHNKDNNMIPFFKASDSTVMPYKITWLSPSSHSESSWIHFRIIQLKVLLQNLSYDILHWGRQISFWRQVYMTWNKEKKNYMPYIEDKGRKRVNKLSETKRTAEKVRNNPDPEGGKNKVLFKIIKIRYIYLPIHQHNCITLWILRKITVFHF